VNGSTARSLTAPRYRRGVVRSPRIPESLIRCFLPSPNYLRQCRALCAAETDPAPSFRWMAIAPSNMRANLLANAAIRFCELTGVRVPPHFSSPFRRKKTGSSSRGVGAPLFSSWGVGAPLFWPPLFVHGRFALFPMKSGLNRGGAQPAANGSPRLRDRRSWGRPQLPHCSSLFEAGRSWVACGVTPLMTALLCGQCAQHATVALWKLVASLPTRFMSDRL
jgi:hypothetical protein